jgi:glutaredoxin
MTREVVVYMSPWCSSSKDAERALTEWNVPATFVNIKEDHAAAARVRAWTGFESVPTILIAEEGRIEPFEPPAALPAGKSPRGFDRGSLITEPNRAQFREWLARHGIL